ncbi:ImmA/IrrE family metallo-endopeptidase [Corynebacterium variabile]|uniref:ImmA/IrrE family metallo-endopeptidase n=1 Tax=Corynebacterium TaxID=1716 RepID=UPI00264A334F|nr:ImmA/IrrE family metallo-endopeptidase [Corynebacterium sp.]MDN6304489.1 ImmA/IrrE family metallo-endopeptidase [Corynebacterium sp.]MDN6354171.1 ImmA/IrrE family metallo-endopeptidase [Corynebacterium sp.]MDN6366312.1 ImmA/IrrE family metallo-endopeptidase [Corynebacterium sp.]MDN6395082.1 ImmA/IrrE family metallo-endopeptidase [Corynebacterium sp.]
MRRGFKTEAKRLALELRSEIGLDAHAPFDPYAFAAEYGIPVVQLSDLEDEVRAHFLRAEGSALSGALIPDGTGLIILENDAQPLARRRTTMCHELAHVILEHQFGVSLSDERKCGLGGDQEAEADWLSGEMLIPADGAFRLARANATDEVAAAEYDVSLAVARWRMNHSGARKVMERSRAKWARTRS